MCLMSHLLRSLGVVKTCRLTYESVDVMHAVFDTASAPFYWTISANSLKGFSEHFGPKSEHLDIYPENGRCIFTSYAERIVGKKGSDDLRNGISRNPLSSGDYIANGI